jgi:hypothetical protein
MMQASHAKELVGIMEAVRCMQCGGTRWSLLPGSLNHLLDEPCDLCGGQHVIERRRPGAGPERLDVERRRAAIADRIAGVQNDSRLTAR